MPLKNFIDPLPPFLYYAKAEEERGKKTEGKKAVFLEVLNGENGFLVFSWNFLGEFSPDFLCLPCVRF